LETIRLSSSKYSINKVKSITVLIFFYWLIYENIILAESLAFGGSLMLILVFGYKLFFPLLLLKFSSPFKLSTFKNKGIFLYTISFLFFIIWGSVPTLISGDVFSWIKLLPVMIFFIATLSFFSKFPYSFIFLIKLIILYVLSALVQYFIINIFGFYGQEFGSFTLAGPFGILGNTQGQFQLPLINQPIIRLCGFWREPSNASAVAFACFFYAKFLYSQGENKKWLYSGYLCFLAGILTLSNAGFLAIGVAVFFGFILQKQSTSSKFIKLIIIIPLISIFIWFSLFSRAYFSKYGTDNPYFLAISGLRAIDIGYKDYDPYDGRLDRMSYAYEETKKNIIGKGIQTTGSKGISGAPAGGFLYWMYLTGFPGLSLLLIREFNLFLSTIKNIKKNQNVLFLGQALVVTLVQHLSYGSWMDPNYIFLASAILISTFWTKKSFNDNKES